MEGVKEVTEVAQGIGDLGALVVTTAAFIVLSLGMWIAIFKWFKSIINEILDQNKTSMADMLDQQNENTRLLISISEGLRNETQLRIHNVAIMSFDKTVEQVCRLIKRIREENNIIDTKATKAKIRGQLKVIHEERNNLFNPFTYQGKSISAFCNKEWIEKVANVIESEIYNEAGANNKRAYTNVKMIYDEIRMEFYSNMEKV